MGTTPNKTLAAFLKTATDAEIQRYWVDRQIANRADGRPAFDVLIGVDGKIAVDLRKGGR